MISNLKDLIQEYVKFQELLISAKADLDVLIAESHKTLPRYQPERAMELEVLIGMQRTYVSRLESIVENWGKALANLGQTFSHEEYEMFNTLVIKRVPPDKTKWSKKKAYKFQNEVFQALYRLMEKEPKIKEESL